MTNLPAYKIRNWHAIRNWRPGGIIDLDGTPPDYSFVGYTEYDRLAVPQNPDYWPEGSEL